MAPRYRVRLMFEWGGGCLWSGDEPTRERFGVGPIEDRLPLSDDTLRRLRHMSARHDGALNWESPLDPGPWSPQEREGFEAEAHEELDRLRAELGPEFDLVYQPL